MKKARLSDAGKALIFVLSGTGALGVTGYTIYESIKTDTATESPAPPPGGINTLVNEFSAAVTAEAQAKLAQAEADAAKPAAVRTACADVTALFAKLAADSGMATKITVTPYEQPSDYFKFGYCELKAGSETITYFTKGDELATESSRSYIIKDLIEKLPPADILKIHQVLGKGLQP